MKDALFGITWAEPQAGKYCIVIACMIVMIIFLYRATAHLFATLAHVNNQKLLIKNFSWFRYRIKMVLLGVSLLCLGLALLRPQWDKKDELIVQEGRDLMIALDVSRSMLAQDCVPNRLEYAKKKIKALVEALQASRCGLLVFSGDAVVQCPLTTDYHAFCMFLDDISVEMISSGTTSLRSALSKLIGMFSGFQENRTKLVVLFTDGEDFSDNLSDIKQKAVDAKVHIFTVGVGTSHGAPVPVYDSHGNQQGFQKDSSGNVVVSRLDSELMQNLSHETGGKYVQALDDNRDVYAIKRWVESFEKSRFSDQKVNRLQEKYYYYSACALVFLLFEWLL